MLSRMASCAAKIGVYVACHVAFEVSALYASSAGSRIGSGEKVLSSAVLIAGRPMRSICAPSVGLAGVEGGASGVDTLASGVPGASGVPALLLSLPQEQASATEAMQMSFFVMVVL